jgi:uncharacterized RDD family membrane protein YckC
MAPMAGVGRRFGAMLYDTLPVLALLIIGTFPFLPFIDNKVLVPREVGALAYVYWVEQLAIACMFFAYFWTRRGQTIGMLAWRLRIQRVDGSLLRWADAFKRQAVVIALLAPCMLGYWLIWGQWSDLGARKLAIYASLAPFVGGYLWMWFDPRKLALPDRLSGTRVIVLPKKQ